MKKELHEMCKDRLKTELVKILSRLSVARGVFIIYPTLKGTRELGDILPTDKRKELVTYLDDDLFFPFLTGWLEDRLQSASMNEKVSTPLSNIPGFENTDLLAKKIIEDLESLPWPYRVTFPLNENFIDCLPKGHLDLTDGVSLVTGEHLIKTGYPILSGDQARDQNAHAVGLIVDINEVEWESSCVYLQLDVSGYIGGLFHTNSAYDAIDKFKAAIGLLICYDLVKEDISSFSASPRSRALVHLLEPKPSLSSGFQLDPDVAQIMSKLIPNRAGILAVAGIETAFQAASEHLQNALKSPVKTSQLINACTWVFESYCGHNQLQSFFQLVVSLEILLGDKAETDLVGINVLLSNRCAYLIGRSHSDRDVIREKFKEIYNVRSKIVHSGHARLAEKERNLFHELRDIVKRVVRSELELLGRDS